MTHQNGWYPPGQVCHPPELPMYLRNVYGLKSIVGVPRDAEVIGVHAVIQAAHRASGIPGMHDPELLMGLAEHLFSAQMARYRSKYSLITFPSDSTYTPPVLPAHISANLEPVSGAPSDEEITKVQEAVRSYQQFSHAPSMFDPHVNMELSQHLFDLQMARYMRRAGERQLDPALQGITQKGIPDRVDEQIAGLTEETITPRSTNNAGARADTTEYHSEQKTQVTLHDTGVREVMEQSNHLVERLVEVMGHINKVLVGIQHTMIRAQFGGAVNYNLHTMGCLINYKGENAATLGTLTPADELHPNSNVDLYIKSDPYSISIPETRLAAYLKFHGLEEGLCFEEGSIVRLKDGMGALARERLGNYLTGCVG